MKVANWGCFFRYEFTTREYVTRTLFPSRNSYTRYIRPHSNAPLYLYGGNAMKQCTCDCVMAERRCNAHADVEQSDGGTRNFFPINAPGMGRFKLFDLVDYI